MMSIYWLKRCGFVFALIMLMACSGEVVTYRIGASYYEPTYTVLGKALQTELERRGKVKLDIVETYGSLDSLKKLRTGRIDFALVQGGFVFDDEGLLSVAALGTEYLHIVVPIISEIQDLADLAGKRVATGIKGTGSRLIVEQIMEEARFDPPIQLVSHENESYQVQISKGNVDAAIFVTDLRNDTWPEISEGQYRLVGVKSSNALAMMLPDIDAAIIPRGVYGNNLSFPSEAVPTLSVRTNLFVREVVPDKVVTHLTETIFDYHVRRDARLPKLTESDARDGAELSLHPAAMDFYTRNDPLSSDEFEIVGVLLAVLIAVLSALNFLWEWYCERWRQKDG